MPDYSWNNGNETEDDTPLVKQLRKLVEQRETALKDMEKQVSELSGRVRSQSVSEVLREIGAKPGLAKFIPSGVETSKDAVSAWLKENEELFGPVQTSADGQAQQTVVQEPPQAQSNPLAPAATPEQVAAFTRMSNSDNNTTSLPDVETSQQQQLASMAKAANGDFDKYLEYLRGDIKLT